jgi:tape measure domain-containing protein
VAQPRIVRILFDVDPNNEVDRQTAEIKKMGQAIGMTEQEAEKLSGQFRSQFKEVDGLRKREQQLTKERRKSQNPAKVKKLNKELEKTESQIKDVTRETKKGGSAFNELAGALGAIGAAVAVGEIGRQAINAAIEYEQLSISIENFVGSAEKGQQVLQTLEQFSVKTPFTPDQVAEAGKALLAFGEPVEALEPTLQKIGDLAAGTGKDFNELTVIYGKARVAGTLFGEDINQLTEAGIPIIDEFAKIMGVGTDQVKKLASEGKISFPILQQAFKNLTSEGSKFGGLTEKLSQTTGGLLSTLQGQFNQILRQIGQKLLPIINEVILGIQQGAVFIGDAFTPIIEPIRGIADAIGRLGEKFGFVTEKGGFVAGILKGIGASIKAMNIPISIALRLIEFIIDGFNALVERFPIIKKAIEGISAAFTFLGDAADAVGGFFESLLGLQKPVSTLADGFRALGGPSGAIAAFAKEVGASKEEIEKFARGLNQAEFAGLNLQEATALLNEKWKEYKGTIAEVTETNNDFTGSITTTAKEIERIKFNTESAGGAFQDAATRVRFWTGQMVSANLALMNGTGSIQAYEGAVRELNKAQKELTDEIDIGFDPSANLENAVRPAQSLAEILGNLAETVDQEAGDVTIWERLGLDPEGAEAAVEAARGALQSIFGLQQALTQKQISELDAAEEARLAKVKGNAAEEERIRAEFEEKREELQKKAAEENKRFAIFDAIISTAVAVTKSLATPPAPNLILAALAAAAGAAQIATIRAQQFAEGGPVTGGTPGKDSVPAWLMPGEFVLTKKTVDKYGPLIQAMHAGKDLMIEPGASNITINADLNDRRIVRALRASGSKADRTNKLLAQMIENANEFRRYSPRRGY